MTRLIFLIIILNGFYCAGQKHNELENYDWNKLTEVSLYDIDYYVSNDSGSSILNPLINIESDSLMLKSLNKFKDKISCKNISRWRLAFSTLPKGPEKDILGEKSYILLLEFDDGKNIPIIFFPKQKAIYDLRKDYGYYHSFPEKSTLINKIFSSCHNGLNEKESANKD